MALKMVYSLLADKEKIFVPLPEEQRLTEESLIGFERDIIKSSIKNDQVLDDSIFLAEHSMPCSQSLCNTSGAFEEEGKSLHSKTLKKVR